MHCESRTFPGLALDGDAPLHQLYEPIRNSESQTSPAVLSSNRGIRLGKLVKQVFLLFRRDSNSRVAHAESDPIVALDLVLIDIHGDDSAIGKLAGVAQQIEQNLSDFRDVRAHRTDLVGHV